MLEKKYALLYASTSANLLNLFGNNNFDEHMSIFNNAINNSIKAHQDLMEFGSERLEIIDPHGIISNMSLKSPIFVTFHTGSYNMLVSLLLKRGEKIFVLSDTSSVLKGDYNSLTTLYDGHYKNGCSCTMVNVEENGAIFNLIRRIKQGAITVAYLDGNKGVGGQTKENENLLDIPFSNGIVKVRKGLAYMSFLTNTQLVLVLNYTENGKDYINFFEPIWSTASNRENFCVEVMNKIFNYFEEHTKKYLRQWSNLPYVHNWSDLTIFRMPPLSKPYASEYASSRKWQFNYFRFCPIIIGDENYLFDRFNYSLMSISVEFTILFSKKTSPEKKSMLFANYCKTNRNIANDFLSKKIFIEA